METTTPSLSPRPAKDYSSSVDTSRPFRSVKEAVAIFGERILVGELYSPKPAYHTPPSHESNSWRFSYPPSPKDEPQEQENQFLDTLKKLEAELEETKAELKQLKERESETEIALATLNAELHKNMSKLAQAEAAIAKKAAGETRTASFGREPKEDTLKEEERRKELMIRMENSPTLAQILSLSEESGYFGKKKQQRKMMKKKPIVPLVGDLFFRKKGSSDTLSNPLFASPNGVF